MPFLPKTRNQKQGTTYTHEISQTQHPAIENYGGDFLLFECFPFPLECPELLCDTSEVSDVGSGWAVGAGCVGLCVG